MRLALCLLAALLPAPALAADVALGTPPPPIADALTREAQRNGEAIDGIAAWELDLEGDGTTEWLVQGVYPYTGGNAVYVRTYLFDGADQGYAASADIGLDRSLKRVEQDGRVITLVLFEMLAGDARCCPSGESYRTLTITP
ncbi:MAG: hypothetical protein ACU0DK_12045 [Pseudooceanicola sp.]